MADESLWTLDRVSLGPARLRDVSLEIRRGVTAVLGWSGAGKTSLLNVLVAFEKQHTGLIRPPSALAWMPQNAGLWPHCTAREHLTIVNASSEENDAMLAAFDLADRAHARPHELSLGEKARLSLARALRMRADVLVLDEPLAHVDPARAGHYWRVIREHLADTGASLVFSTHDPDAVLGEADRVVCLAAGRVVHEGPVDALYDDPPTTELMSFLGPGNWLTPEEAALWLSVRIQRPCCFRPEQLEIAPAPVSHIVVRSALFRGAIAEAELHHINAAARRSFFHRPAGPDLVVDEPATIRLRE